MNLRISCFTTTLSITIGVLVFAPMVSAFTPNLILTDEQLTDHTTMTANQIQQFLAHNGSGLTRKKMNGNKLPSTIIAEAALEYTINPRVLLILLQKEQSLVIDPTPSTKQLDWAMGFGVCDSCSLKDPGIQKYKGFETQVRSAASLLRKILDNPIAYNFRQGVQALIDRRPLTPLTNATAALYVYTPHLHGNQVFWGLWSRWFNQNYPDGTLVRSPATKTIWYIQFGARRAVRSISVLQSRFGSQPILTSMSEDEILKYPEGPAISLPNYSLVRTPNGRISLLDGETFRPIPSPNAFRLLGFNPEEVDDIPAEALLGYREGDPLTTESVYPTGAILRNTKTKELFFARDGKKQPITDTILLKRFPTLKIINTTSEELDNYPTTDPIRFADGTLVKLPRQSSVYFISQGKRRPIASEKVFTAMKLNRATIITITSALAELHPLGEILDVATADIPLSDPRPALR